jgi:hypothetical protein
MDQNRFEELSRKRSVTGLTRDEADELGRMMAEREGKPYSNADHRVDPESLPAEGRDADEPYSETEAKELREHPDIKGSEERTTA